MRFNDAVFEVVLIGFAVVAALAARSFPEMPGQSYGPALFPQILSAGLAVSGLLLVRSGLRDRAGQPLIALDDWARSGRGISALALTIAGLAFYILASERLGFIPTAFLMVATVMIRLRDRWVSSVLIAAAVTMIVHWIFHGLLLMPLPWGIIEPLVY